MRDTQHEDCTEQPSIRMFLTQVTKSPVALFPQFSLVLEKIFCTRLEEFIEKHNLLSESQYRLRTNRSPSTSLTILELIEKKNTSTLDKKKYTFY